MVNQPSEIAGENPQGLGVSQTRPRLQLLSFMLR